MSKVLTQVDEDDDYAINLPDDWGLMGAACADGQHRYLPDAPRCGCGAMINREVERSRLERAVINAAKAWNRTNYRDVAKCEELLSDLGDTVDALIAFESSQAEK